MDWFNRLCPQWALSPFYHIHVANLRYDVATINANTNCLKAVLLCVARNQIEAVHVRPGAAMTSVVYMVHANETATATCLHSSPSDWLHIAHYVNLLITHHAHHSRKYVHHRHRRQLLRKLRPSAMLQRVANRQTDGLISSQALPLSMNFSNLCIKTCSTNPSCH